MDTQQDKPLTRAVPCPPWVRVASLVLLAAAGVWLAACSGAEARVRITPPSSAPATYGTTDSPQGAASGPTAADGSRAGSSAAAAAGGAVRPAILTARDQGQGGITIKATWVVEGSPEANSAELDRYLAFVITMDTHSGDLGQFNLMKMAVLRDDKGNETPPVAWEGLSDDSHHRSGVMKFTRGAEKGAARIELVIRGVGGGPERALRWELGG